MFEDQKVSRDIDQARATRAQRRGGTGDFDLSPPLATEGNDGDQRFVKLDDGFYYFYIKIDGGWRRLQLSD
jgi:hypothetical protein